MAKSQSKGEDMGEQLERRTRRRTKGQSDEEGEQEAPPALVSTGSTLLDLAISGGRWHGGGIPPGILAEIFGPASAGKTVLLSEIAGGVRRQGGELMFRDPEARLNKEFARLFDLDIDEIDYDIPATVREVFEPVQGWKPNEDVPVHGAFADSLAALTTDMEEQGNDAYGMRRAKEFSEQCRLTCREIAKRNILMVCSNQVRQNLDAGPYGQKYKSPGGEAIAFYSSLRLRAKGAQKVQKKKKIKGTEVKRAIGVETEFEVYKSSVWQPNRSATLYIMYDYGIDDIRSNLQYLKTTKGASKYTLGDRSLAGSIEDAIDVVEDEELEDALREEVIGVWQEIENEFKRERKAKKRK